MQDAAHCPRWSILAALVASVLSQAAYAQTGEDPGGHQAPPSEQQPAQKPPAQQPTAQDVDDATLDRFAKAAVDLQRIEASASTEMDQIVNGAEIGEIQLRTQRDMTSAVENAGLSVEEYNRIAKLMSSDPEVRERIMERVNANEGD
jgi:hypothetical protein